MINSSYRNKSCRFASTMDTGRKKFCRFHGFRVRGSGFRVVVAASPRIYMGRCPKIFWDAAMLVSPAFPSRGRCPEGADRAPAVWKEVGKCGSSRRFTRVPKRRWRGPSFTMRLMPKSSLQVTSHQSLATNHQKRGCEIIAPWTQKRTFDFCESKVLFCVRI